MVKENRGRRLFFASPDHSLLLLKATGTTAHAGGKRFETDSTNISSSAAGSLPALPSAAQAIRWSRASASTRPSASSLGNSRQQLAVVATFSDGTKIDVTNRATYESNDTEVAHVDGHAVVRTLTLAGEAAVMARYQGQVATFRATVPLGMKLPVLRVPGKNTCGPFRPQEMARAGHRPVRTVQR